MESKKVKERKKKEEEEEKNIKVELPEPDDVISDWFSQDHPDRLGRTCWRDHSQYREYHKAL
jgi:hypothetical protein